MYVPNWFILLSRHWSLNLLASATYHIIAASIYPLSGAVNFYHIFSHSYSNSFLFKWKSIFTCGVRAACQLLGGVPSRTFEIPLPREVSYEYAGCDGRWVSPHQLDKQSTTSFPRGDRKSLMVTSTYSLLNYLLLFYEIYIIVNLMRKPVISL